MATEKVRIEISAKDRAKGVFKGITGQFQSMTKGALSFKGVMAGLGVALAGRQILRFAKGSIDAFKIQELAVTGLNSALQATGRFSAAASQAIQDSATAIQRVTTVGDEALLKATATVATLAKGLSADELAKSQEAIVGISDAFGIDLNSAAQLVGKTLGSTTNAMSRYGIELDTGATQSEKLAQILGQTNTLFEVAKGKTLTVAGASAQLGNAFGDMKESIGAVLVDIIGLRDAQGNLTTKIFSATDTITRNKDVIANWGRVVLAVGKVFIAVVKSIIRAAFNLGQIVGNIFRGLGSIFIGLVTFDLGKVKTGFAEMKDAIKQDVNDLVDTFDDLILSFVNVSLAAERAFATRPGGTRGSQPAPAGTRQPTVTTAPSAPARAPVPTVFLGFPGKGKKGDAAPAAEFLKVSAEKASRAMSGLADDITRDFSRMAFSVARDARFTADMVTNMLQSIVQSAIQSARQSAGGGGIFGGLLGGIFGGFVAGGIGLLASSLLGGGRSAPSLVRIDSFSQQALDQQESRRGPDVVHLTIVDKNGFPIREIEWLLNRRSGRDGNSRIPGGVIGGGLVLSDTDGAL